MMKTRTLYLFIGRNGYLLEFSGWFGNLVASRQLANVTELVARDHKKALHYSNHEGQRNSECIVLLPPGTI
jgi:hypothetical protein